MGRTPFRTLGPKLVRVLGQLAMLAVAVLFVAPVIWMFSTSFKPSSEILRAAPTWLPHQPTGEHYVELFTSAEDFPVLRWLLNSIGISLSVTFLVLLVTSTAAYAFSRLKFKGRDTLFLLVVATMMIPAQVSLIPAFLIVKNLGWFNTYAGLIIPGLASAFGVFLLRQFFISIPVELEEAAVIDGASVYTIFWRVILPLAKPALATLAIFTFMGSWNDFVWPLLVTNDMNMRTLPVGLTIFQGRHTSDYGLTMAAAAVATIPMIIAFAIFQKRITEGIALTGLKG